MTLQYLVRGSRQFAAHRRAGHDAGDRHHRPALTFDLLEFADYRGEGHAAG